MELFIEMNRGNSKIREERDCSDLEFVCRRIFSRIFYWGIYRRLHPDQPFYTPAAIRELARIEDQIQEVFEWGSGVSTIWWASRVARITTIEHDGDWYARVRGWLAEKALSTADVQLVEPSEGSFHEYCQAIDRHPDESFDLIAVDGRERVACVRRAVPKLRRGGWLLLDDSHRPKYREAHEILGEFRCTRFDFGLLQTSLFRKR